MKANKKGISLIVLIITIIVIIILAAAIILSITKSNPISNATKAVNQSDLKTAQEAVTLWLGDRWAQAELQYEVGCYYSGVVSQSTGSTIYRADYKSTDTDATHTDKATVSFDSNTGKYTISATNAIVKPTTSTTEIGTTADTYTTADLGLGEFTEVDIVDNYVVSVVKNGVRLTYDQTTGKVSTNSSVAATN